ncbi:MAG: hypothetical protein EOP84_13235 [Verrucomicrobiaceae bacterium]|nr:MAG: hypothetical protein EOP84_13235 [Verrucomicrobiaceae bacterium]
MRPCISEFSYGFALTEELLHTFGTGGKALAAPVLPSLINEATVGYDLKMEVSVGVFFLQFKLTEKMVGRNATEAKQGHFKLPFYRMHLRPLGNSAQHNLLFKLETKHPECVWYAAPAFYLASEFDDAYTKTKVVERSVFIRPSLVGRLTDYEEHHISFTNATAHNYRVYSKNGRDIDGMRGAEFVGRIEERRSSSPTNKWRRVSELDGLLNDVIGLAQERGAKSISRDRFSKQKDRTPRQVAREVSYVARTYLGLQMFVVSENET